MKRRRLLIGRGDRIELEPNCGHERGKAERESAGEILSEAPLGAKSKDLTFEPAAEILSQAEGALEKIVTGQRWSGRQDLNL